MPDLSIRSNEAEIMDDLAAPENELRQNLRELEVINKLLGGYSIVLHALDKLDLPKDKPTSIIDIGSGGGDMLREIAGWAQQRKKEVVLTGIDYNRVMIHYAMEHSADYRNISYKQMSVWDEQMWEERADVVLCNLFCHHFTDAALVQILRMFYSISNKAVIINDLHRHWFAYHAIGVLTSLFSKTYMVKNDAKLSVARAFTRKELEQLLHDAGITNYTIKWRWAWRWEVIIKK